MKVMPGRDPGQDSRRGREDWFTGVVWQDPLLEDAEAGVRAVWVTFEPAARTNWHRHADSQLLYVLTGRGRVANRDGDTSEIRAGDLVHIPPGEEHWHGAGPATNMTHLAVTIGETDWLAPVSAEDYEAVAG